MAIGYWVKDFDIYTECAKDYCTGLEICNGEHKIVHLSLFNSDYRLSDTVFRIY
jgi:hypothetical protein